MLIVVGLYDELNVAGAACGFGGSDRQILGEC
jgi:hypothetical protein